MKAALIEVLVGEERTIGTRLCGLVLNFDKQDPTAERKITIYLFNHSDREDTSRGRDREEEAQRPGRAGIGRRHMD